MEPQNRRKRKYALLLVTENEDGSVKQHTISSALVELLIAILFVLLVVVVCKFVYDGITLKNAKEHIVEQLIIINNLTDENEALTVENATLTSKITVLSETVSMKAATEDAISHETVENAMPKGFPLSGSATMKSAEDGEPMIIFNASEGTNVISSGTGTVISVDADETYGTKVVIDHGNGYMSVYRNQGSALVKNGEELGKGYILFAIGEENQELGYQIMEQEQYIDPMELIDING